MQNGSKREYILQNKIEIWWKVMEKRDYNNAESSDLNIQEQKYIHN